MPDKDVLETFENPHSQRDYDIKIDCAEFTSLCPKTGQPDFGTINITYCPDQLCIELKSLKLYLQSYRNEGIFYEDLINAILNDLAACCQPRRMIVVGDFRARGGITTKITAQYP